MIVNSMMSTGCIVRYLFRCVHYTLFSISLPSAVHPTNFLALHNKLLLISDAFSFCDTSILLSLGLGCYIFVVAVVVIFLPSSYLPSCFFLSHSLSSCAMLFILVDPCLSHNTDILFCLCKFSLYIYIFLILRFDRFFVRCSCIITTLRLSSQRFVFMRSVAFSSFFFSSTSYIWCISISFSSLALNHFLIYFCHVWKDIA